MSSGGGLHHPGACQMSGLRLSFDAVQHGVGMSHHNGSNGKRLRPRRRERVMAKLDRDTRAYEMFLARSQRRMSYREIAAAFECSVPTAYKHVRRAAEKYLDDRRAEGSAALGQEIEAYRHAASHWWRLGMENNDKAAMDLAHKLSTRYHQLIGIGGDQAPMVVGSITFQQFTQNISSEPLPVDAQQYDAPRVLEHRTNGAGQTH